MRLAAKTWKTLAKVAVALAILAFVARHFYRDLSHPDVALLSFRVEWVACSALLYLCALFFSAWFWRYVLIVLGDRASWRHTLRAYFISQLGKYVPGKAWALLLRGSLIRPAQVHFGLALVTAFYEVLTTMATGALLAIGIFIVIPPEVAGLDWHPVYTGVLLLGLLGVPLLPGVFNFMMLRLARRFPAILSENISGLRLKTLAAGMLATSVGWLLLGLSVWAMLEATLPEPPTLTFETWARITGANALAYVAGFLAVVMPSGVGVREYFLLALLSFAGPEPLIAAAVLLLRLTWTAAELVLAAILAPMAAPPTSSDPG